MEKELKFYCVKYKVNTYIRILIIRWGTSVTGVIGKTYFFLKSNGNSVTVCAHSPENQPYPELHQKQCGQQGEGVISASLVLHPTSGSPTQEGCGPVEMCPEEGPKDDPRVGTPLL